MHGNVGRASNRADHKRREQVLKLVRDNYSGEPQERFGPTLASEHLAADTTTLFAAFHPSKRGKRGELLPEPRHTAIETRLPV